MKAIPLSGSKAAGRVVLVDDEDYELASSRTWCVWERQKEGCRPDGPYAVSYKRTNGRAGTLFMHQLLTGYPQTDHHNGNGLDNRRSNLRPTTTAQNSYNSRPQIGTSSRFKGVTWHKQARRWQASIKFDGKFRYLGLFVSEEDAAAAYAAAALELQGEYAYVARGGAA
jgi:hypothetical protein